MRNPCHFSSLKQNVANTCQPAVGVRDASRVIDIGRANEGSGFDNMSHPAYNYLHDHSQTTDVAAVDFGGGPMSLDVHGFGADPAILDKPIR